MYLVQIVQNDTIIRVFGIDFFKNLFDSKLQKGAKKIDGGTTWGGISLVLVPEELSMFTRKLEAQLCYQSIPYEWEIKSQDKSAAINARVGTHFIPILKTPDGWMLNDTISIGPFLNDRFKQCPVIPDNPAQRGACGA